MRHKTIQKKLLGYLDNELSPREQQKIRNHLKICSTCLQELQQLKALWQIEQPIERMKIPPFIWTRISARLKGEEKKGFFNGIKNTVVPFLGPVIMAVLLLWALIGGIQLGNIISRPSDQQAAMQTTLAENDFGSSYFEALPPGSIGTRFLAIAKNEIKK